MKALDYRTQTVLVTGASSGIGAEFARGLAARGAGLVLVARRQDRLDALARELTDRHGVDVTVLALDLTTPGVGAVIDRELIARGVEVTGLINNAGFATHGPFHSEELDRLRTEIAVDITSVVDISRTFIERLRDRGDGFLINVASMAAYVVTTAFDALARRNPPPSVVAGRANRIAAAAGRVLLTRRRSTAMVGCLMRRTAA